MGGRRVAGVGGSLAHAVHEEAGRMVVRRGMRLQALVDVAGAWFVRAGFAVGAYLKGFACCVLRVGEYVGCGGTPRLSVSEVSGNEADCVRGRGALLSQSGGVVGCVRRPI